MASLTVRSIWIDTIILSLASINGYLLFIALSKKLCQISKDKKPNIHYKIMHLLALSSIFTSTLFCATQIHPSFENITSKHFGFSTISMIGTWRKYSLNLFWKQGIFYALILKIRNVLN